MSNTLINTNVNFSSFNKVFLSVFLDHQTTDIQNRTGADNYVSAPLVNQH